MPTPPKETQMIQPDALATEKLVTDSMVGLTFGDKYHILEEISRGGMGRIFKAEQIALRRKVAIKVIMASDDYVANQRFLLEASLTANLDHPNIVKIFDFGRTDDGVLFLVMELLPGDNLDAWVKESGPLSVEDALQVTKQMCGALAEAHQKNVIHRDIKPSNIILYRRPGAGLTAKLIDFGLVKSVDQQGSFSRTGVVMGTPMYMAPEQISAKGVDDRVDVYALGLTIYYALTGQVPYPDRGVSSLMHAQLNEAVQPMHEIVSHVSSSHLVNWIIGTAVAKSPAHRFQNALQMLKSVDICAAHLSDTRFPSLEILEGELHSDGERMSFDDATPSQPLVDPTAYVKDGSAISNDFAETLSLTGIYDVDVLSPGLSQPSIAASSGQEQIPAKTRSWLLMAVGLVVIALGGAGVVYVMSGNEPAMEKTVEQVSVELSSAPDGADVYRDGKLIGSTPFQIRLNAEETANLELKLPGYAPRTVELSSVSPKVTIRLNPLEAPKPETAPPEPAKPRPARVAKPKPKATPKAAEPEPKPVEPPPKQDKKSGVRDPWAD